MGETLDKAVGYSFFHRVAIIIEALMIHIQDRLLYMAYGMTENIDSHHGHGIPLIASLPKHVLFQAILNAQILPESECLTLEPRFLQLHKYQMLRSIIFTHSRGKVDTEHRNRVAGLVHIFMRPALYFGHLFLQQGRDENTSHTLVFKQIFENGVVNRIGNFH